MINSTNDTSNGAMNGALNGALNDTSKDASNNVETGHALSLQQQQQQQALHGNRVFMSLLFAVKLNWNAFKNIFQKTH